LRRLVLAEKFSAALRLATILSEGMAKKVRADGVSYFTFSTGDLEVIVLRTDQQLQHYWRDGAGWHAGPVIGPA